MIQDTNISVILVLSLPLTWLTYKVYAVLTDDLRSVPGPFWARFTRLWYLNAVKKGDFENTNIELHRKHGPIVRLGPNMYSFSEQDAINKIYSTQTVFAKSRWYFTFQQPDEPNVFSTHDNKYAAEMRRKYKTVYDSLLTYEGAIDDCARLLEKRLSDFADRGENIDIGWWLTCYAFDVNGEIAFSKRFGHLDEGKDIGGIVNALAERLSYTSQVGIYPSLHPIFWKMISAMLFLTKQVDYTYTFAQMQIDDHKKRNPGQNADAPDMLSRLLTLHKQDANYFTQNDVLIGAYTSIVAGADTTKVSLSSVIYYLHKYPATLKKLLDEIDQFDRDGKLSDPITFGESKHMSYLNAVIKEAQRMHAPIGLPLWRVSPESGSTIGGRYFPAGTEVGVNIWVAHRASPFEPDSDTFRPERWLEASKGQLVQMNASFIPFGAGPRVCQGQTLALMEMAKVIPQLLRKYDFDIPQNLTATVFNRWVVGLEGIKGTIRHRKQT